MTSLRNAALGIVTKEFSCDQSHYAIGHTKSSLSITSNGDIYKDGLRVSQTSKTDKVFT